MRFCPALAAVVVFWLFTSRDAAAQDQISSLVRMLESDKKPMRLQAARGLGSCGKGARSAVPALCSLLDREQDPQVYLQAMKALTQIGAQAELQALLTHANPVVRQQAAWGLGVIGPDAKNSVPDLIKSLKDRDPLTRGLAAQALGEIGPAAHPAVSDLIKLLADPQLEVRQQSLRALTEIGIAAGPSLETILKNDEPAWVRIAALQILASHGPEAEQATPTLIPLLKDPDAKVRTQTAQTLAAIGPLAKQAIPDLLHTVLDKSVEVQSAAFAALTSVGQGDLSAAMKGVQEANAKGSWSTPYVLSQYGDKAADAVPHLIQSLGDKNPATRLGSAIALGQIGPQAKREAVPALTAALKDQVPQVRFAAYQALMLMDEQKRDHFLQLAQRQAEYARLLAEKYQQELNKQQELLHMWSDPAQQGYSQQVILQHLAFSHTSTSSHPMREWTIERIKEMGPESLPALVQGINMTGQFGIGFL